MGCVKQRSVARISEELATELGVNFRDNNDNPIVSLQLAAELPHSEFSVIAANYTESAERGILPLNPAKPILRPRP